jgi:hypothetical protein
VSDRHILNAQQITWAERGRIRACDAQLPLDKEWMGGDKQRRACDGDGLKDGSGFV